MLLEPGVQRSSPGVGDADGRCSLFCSHVAVGATSVVSDSTPLPSARYLEDASCERWGCELGTLGQGQVA